MWRAERHLTLLMTNESSDLEPSLRTVHALMREGDITGAEALLHSLRLTRPTCAPLYDAKLAELRGGASAMAMAALPVPVATGSRPRQGPLADLLVMVPLLHPERRRAIASTWQLDLERLGGTLYLIEITTSVSHACSLGPALYVPKDTPDPLAAALDHVLPRQRRVRWVLVLDDDCHLDAVLLARDLLKWSPSAEVDVPAPQGGARLFAVSPGRPAAIDAHRPGWLTHAAAHDETAHAMVATGCLHEGHFERRQQQVEAARWQMPRTAAPDARFMHSPNDRDATLGFDHVYLVNLRSEVERRASALLDLDAQGVRAELVSAIDGHDELGRKLFDQILARPVGALHRFPVHGELERYRARHFIDSRGAVGYILTYVGILRDAQRRGFRKILIVEDDVLLAPDLRPRMAALLQALGDDYRVLQLGASQYDWTGIDEPASREAGYYEALPLHTCGSFAMGLDSRIFDELIEALLWFEAPFDHLPLGELYERHRGQCFVAYPNLVMPVVTQSSIRGPRDQREHAMRMRWPIEKFRFPRPHSQLAVVLAPGVPVPVADASSLAYGVHLLYFRPGPDGLRPAHPAPVGHEPLPEEAGDKPDRLVHAGADIAFELRRPADASEIFAEALHQLAARSHGGGMTREWLRRLPLLNPPLVLGRATVVIPTQGRREPLELALRSVLDQDHPDLEVLVVNENEPGSALSDWLHMLVAGLAAQRGRPVLRLLQHTRTRNAAAARNTGLLAATGEYVSFLDDDDAYLPGRISRLVQTLDAAPAEVGAAYCGYLGWNSKANQLDRYPTDELVWRMLALEYDSHYICTNTVTYRTKALLAINGFDEAFRRHQDLELNARFFALHRVETVREPLVQLNPLLADSTNKLFDSALFETKRRFLDKFSTTIANYGPRAEVLLQRHAREMQDYASPTTDLVALALGSTCTLSTVLLRQLLAPQAKNSDA